MIREEQSEHPSVIRLRLASCDTGNNSPYIRTTLRSWNILSSHLNLARYGEWHRDRSDASSGLHSDNLISPFDSPVGCRKIFIWSMRFSKVSHSLVLKIRITDKWQISRIGHLSIENEKIKFLLRTMYSIWQSINHDRQEFSFLTNNVDSQAVRGKIWNSLRIFDLTGFGPCSELIFLYSVGTKRNLNNRSTHIRKTAPRKVSSPIGKWSILVPLQNF